MSTEGLSGAQSPDVASLHPGYKVDCID